MEKKDLRFELKSIGEDRTFTGWLSTYGNEDSVGDAVQPGAYKKTLSENGGTVPLLWAHDPKLPLGKLKLQDKPEGLWVTGKLVEGVKQADEAYRLLKADVIRGLSIGYQTVKSKMRDGVRHLTEIRLYEGSLVTFAANPQAQVVGVKQQHDWYQELRNLEHEIDAMLKS